MNCSVKLGPVGKNTNEILSKLTIYVLLVPRISSLLEICHLSDIRIQRGVSIKFIKMFCVLQAHS